ncbi:MAG: hypothetical protein HPY89_09850 [Pelotomaculum sp.]|uniref:N-acetyltransferase domain-containing protein n=1 Tax=Pelotomaculum thermopropionicum (strain DSM 13744 / JCM 10971 / SI) TaxID=370438 RepID=A5D657_PELTS|nr:hypothetical protein [Pelotomaculum sp.]BAF58280.1 hypothetical protein PTH_0099 [Pelotomaculum thermopropionicum SI]
MAVEVVQAASEEAMKVFNAFPGAIYRNFFRAPRFPVMDRSSPHYDPMFGRAEAQPFLALRNGLVMGRIAACINHALPDKQTGFFGYFESFDDPAVAGALLSAAAGWLYARKRNRMIGPVDLTPHERLGLLVEGFGGRHQPGLPYNPPYYAALLERCGLKTEMNLYAYRCGIGPPYPEKLVRVAARAGRNENLLLRQLNFNDLEGEGEIFSELHNGAMAEIWGFVPLSPEEGTAILQRLKGIYDPGLVLVAEVDGRPAGLCLALHPGSRIPFARPDARLAVLAVLPRFRFRGLEAALILECARRAWRRGITGMEFSLVSENNWMMNNIIQSMERARKNRVYRVYKL